MWKYYYLLFILIWWQVDSQLSGSPAAINTFGVGCTTNVPRADCNCLDATAAGEGFAISTIRDDDSACDPLPMSRVQMALGRRATPSLGGGEGHA
jgi:hypothetical protein